MAELADRIARCVVDAYNKRLPSKKGKPSKDKNEWTVLSAFVLGNKNGHLEVHSGLFCLFSALKAKYYYNYDPF